MTADWDAVLAEAERLNVPSPQHAQRITFEGYEYCLVSPEDYEAIFDALLSAALRERESAKEVERLREALKRQRTALQIVRDRQHGRVSEADLNQGIALIDAALAAEKGEQT